MTKPILFQSPKSLGYRMPAEWEQHASCWLAWPCDKSLWEDNLAAAQQEFTALCYALADESLDILVANEAALHDAQVALAGVRARFHVIPYGDIWLRDTAPLFLTHPNGTSTAAACFQFNGWGEKYVLEGDDAVAKKIASIPETDSPRLACPLGYDQSVPLTAKRLPSKAPGELANPGEASLRCASPEGAKEDCSNKNSAAPCGLELGGCNYPGFASSPGALLGNRFGVKGTEEGKIHRATFHIPFILEGGSIDVDGEGTCLTTQECLLNRNRNFDYTKEQIEHIVAESLGVSKVLWLNNGLINDHTDGHIDTIARFVAPAKVVCMQARNGVDDPNHAVMEEITRDLCTFTDAKGRKLEVIRIPSPGKILSKSGDILPASYLNFYIGNNTVVVPTYASPFDDEAVAAIAALFPNRKTVGLSARAILSGGGAFHCITQQQPLVIANEVKQPRCSALDCHGQRSRNDEGMLNVAALQASYSENFEDNIAKTTRMIREAAAQGAQIILPPELFQSPYFCKEERDEFFAWAHPAHNHPMLTHFQRLAQELNVVIPISFFERDNHEYYNSIAVIDATGSQLGIYRKSHIPDGPGYEEKFYFKPGNTGFKVWNTRFGTIGVGICWDQWFPECARAMMLMGAELLLYPTAIGSEPNNPSLDTKDLWQRAMIGHAVSNVVPVIAANRVGVENGQTFYGSSFICNHRGEKISELDRVEEGIISGAFNLNEIRSNRASFGFFRDRRPSLYEAIIKP